MDFPLWGGWHVTIFHPWLWLLLGVAVVAAVVWVVKTLVAS